MGRNKIIALSLFCVSSIVLTTTTVFGSYGTEHVKMGAITGGAGEIRVWNDQSVIDQGYKGTVDNAIADWNAASTKIGLYYNSTDPEVKVYASSLPAGTYGVTDYWDYNWLGQVSQVSASDITNGTDYDQARIRLGYNNMSGWTWQERYMNTGHEFGHVLGLNHFENSPAHSGDHWMKSGKYSMPDPSTTDTDHVRNKWGN